MLSETPGRYTRYKSYTIHFDESDDGQGLEILASVPTDAFWVIGIDTYIINGKQLKALDKAKIPYEILKKR